ncbi:hypothetical protein [Streptomyces triculaminicus]|uniref:hypothetical protein n=1 Tax=Streptomyces triculaminicus TaxID=2816232 RepID=UPI0037CEFFE5
MPFVTPPPPAGNGQPPGMAADEPSTAARTVTGAPSFTYTPAATPAATLAPQTGRDPTAPDAAVIAREVAREVARRHAGLLAEAVVPSLGLSRRMRRAVTRWQSQSQSPTRVQPPAEGSPWGGYPPR